MGYMTVVTILNDGFDQMKKYPEKFIENIEKGMGGEMDFVDNQLVRKSINSYPIGNHCNPMEVVSSFHADQSKVLFVGQNCTTDLTNINVLTKREIEFELSRIEEAKRLLEFSEEQLKKKLNKIDK